MAGLVPRDRLKGALGMSAIAAVLVLGLLASRAAPARADGVVATD